jgi:ribosomal protein L16 Arg81 hydroxylase
MTRTARTCQLAPDWEAATHQPDGIDRALPWSGSNLHPRGRSRAAQLQQILQTMHDMVETKEHFAQSFQTCLVQRSEHQQMRRLVTDRSRPTLQQQSLDAWLLSCDNLSSPLPRTISIHPIKQPPVLPTRGIDHKLVIS